MNDYEDRLLETFNEQLAGLRERTPAAPAVRRQISIVDPPSDPPLWKRPRVLGAAAAIAGLLTVMVMASVIRPNEPTPVGAGEPAQTGVAASSSTSDGDDDGGAAPSASGDVADAATRPEATEIPGSRVEPTAPTNSEQAATSDSDTASDPALADVPPNADDPPATEFPLQHVIAPGDFLGAIAETYNVSVESILAANPSLDPSLLQIGQILIIDPRAIPAPSRPTPPTPPPSASSIAELPAISGEQCVVGLSDGDTLNVRTEPSTNGEIVWWLEPGQCGIYVIGSAPGGWLQVRGGQDEAWIGFASGNFLADGAPRPTPEPTPDSQVGGWLCPAAGLVDYLGIHAQPSYASAEIAQIYAGDCVLQRAGRDQVVDGVSWIPVQRFAGGGAVGPIGWVEARSVVSGAQTFPTPVPTSPPADSSTPTPTATPSPSQPIVVTFDLVRAIDLPDQELPSLSAYRVFIGETDLGTLTADGSFAFDAAVLPATIRVQASWVDDPFCWWTGQAVVSGPGRLTVEIAAICA